MDFELLLVLVTLAAGVVVLLDRLLWRAARDPAAELPVVVDYSRALFPLLLIVVLLRSFLYEPFRIPSGSMIPTLRVGDFILVEKFSYGVRLPVVPWRLFPTGAPERGDVIVFRYPEDPSLRYIKRVVGLPGDHVSLRDGWLYLDGERVAVAEAGTYAGAQHRGATLYREELPGAPHELLRLPERPPLEDDFVVPEGHYYVLGDNRDSSNDSRRWGPVPESHLVGEALVVWFSWGPGSDPDWDRIGLSID